MAQLRQMRAATVPPEKYPDADPSFERFHSNGEDCYSLRGALMELGLIFPLQRFRALPQSAHFRALRCAANTLGRPACTVPHRSFGQPRHLLGYHQRRPRSNYMPVVSVCLLVSAAPASCGKGNRLACAPVAANICWAYFPCVPSVLLSATVLPEKGFSHHSCGVFRRWQAPQNFGISCP